MFITRRDKKVSGLGIHKNFLLSNCSKQFPQMQKAFPSVLPIRYYLVSLRLYCSIANFPKRSLQGVKRHQVTKVTSEESSFVFSKTILCKQRTDVLPSQKGLKHIEATSPPFFKRLI